MLIGREEREGDLLTCSSVYYAMKCAGRPTCR
jgi:hypothetical protein